MTENLVHLPPDILGDVSRRDLVVAAHKLRCAMFPSVQLARVAALLDRIEAYQGEAEGDFTSEPHTAPLAPVLRRGVPALPVEAATASGGLPSAGKRYVSPGPHWHMPPYDSTKQWDVA